MLIAIPTEYGKMCGHFGHAPQFTIYQIEGKEIQEKQVLAAPPHQPGLLPAWLKEQQVNIVIAGNMGSKARELFTQNGIQVIFGVSETDADTIIASYIKDDLKTDAELTCCH